MNNSRQFLLGLFFLVTLSILAVYTLFWTDTLSLFRDPILLRVYFPEAIGLREGDPVQAVGVRIGRVTELEIDINAPERERVLATLSLNQELELSEGAQIMIQESTLLGGRHVFIDPGAAGGPPLEITAEPLYGVVQKNPIEALSEVGDVFAENREALNNIVANLDSLVSDVKSGKGLVGRILVDDAMADDLAATLDDVSTMTARVEAGEGLLGALIQDQSLVEDVRGITSNLSTVAADLQAGKGVAGRLIYDDALADEVDAAIQSFSNVAQGLERGDGVVGKLLSDEAFSDEFTSIVGNIGEASHDLAEIVTHVRTGEGTVGKLLMDQELYDEALAAVKLLTRSLEDFREAAPVTAFTSVLFQGF